MKRLAILLTASVLYAASVPYTDVQNVERSISQRIDRYSVADPIDLLGLTRGVYLEGTGAVFTAEVELVQGPVVSPFRQVIPKEELVKLRDRKKARLPELRKIMQDSLVSSATMLKTMPAQERIVFAVTLFYHPYEDASGLPKQILMQASKQSLLDFESGKSKSLESAVQVQEF